MFVIGIGFLVLFFALSAHVGHEDPRRDAEPRDTLALWARFLAR